MSLFLHNCLTESVDDLTDLQLYVTVLVHLLGRHTECLE